LVVHKRKLVTDRLKQEGGERGREKRFGQNTRLGGKTLKREEKQWRGKKTGTVQYSTREKIGKKEESDTIERQGRKPKIRSREKRKFKGGSCLSF